MNRVFDLIRNLRIALGCIGELRGYQLRFVSVFLRSRTSVAARLSAGMCKRRKERLRADRPRSGLLASRFPYHRASKNCINDLHILPDPLWGGSFQGTCKWRKPETQGEIQGMIQGKK